MSMSAKIAKNVVRDCLRIKEDEVVMISTWQHTIDLANALAFECHKAGALPIVTLDTDNLYYLNLVELPRKQLKKRPTHLMTLLDVVTASIFIAGPENPVRMRKIPATKFSAIFEAGKPFTDKMLKRKIRSAFIMLGYVTPQRAKTYGFSYIGWKRAMNAALRVDYKKMLRLGRKVRKALEETREVRITGREGTDLSFEIKGRPVHIFDGVIDEEDILRGSLSTALPTGSVSVAPIETSAEGRVVFDVPIPQVGKMIHGLEWTFENGRIKEFKAKKNLGAVKTLWEAGHGDKDSIGSFTLGINPRARLGYVINPLVLGSATIGVGDNRELRGKNDSDYGLIGTVSRPTVELDGEMFVKNGKCVG